MPRSEARVRVSIWDDDDFLALSHDEQRLYLFVMSQDDLTNHGVLGMRLRRLTRRATMSVDDFLDVLWRLDDAGFLVVDEDTEEICIRTHIRNDGIYRQPFMLIGAQKGLPGIESERIREAILTELERIGRDFTDTTPPGSVPVLVEMIEYLRLSLGRDPASPSQTLPTSHESTSTPSSVRGSSRGSTEGSPGGSARPNGEGEGVGDLLKGRTNTGGGVRKRPPAAKSAKRKTSTTRGTRIPADFAETVTPEMVAWALRECPLIDGKAETKIFVSYWLGESGAKASKRNWVQAWQTWLRKEQRDAAKKAARYGDTPAKRITPRTAERCKVAPHHFAEPASNCSLCAADRKAVQTDAIEEAA